MCGVPTRSVSRSADLLIVGALLSLSACGSDRAAPPGVSVDPTVVDEGGEDGGIGEEDAASERMDSGSRSDAGVDSGRADAQTPPGDAGRDADALPPEDDIDAALARIDGGKGELGNLASVERLLVADGRNARAYALDVADGRLLDTFTFRATPSVYSGPSGRFGYVLVPDADLMQVINMGLLADPKAESTQLTEPVQLLSPGISATGPSSFTSLGKAEVGVFFGGSAELVAFTDDGSAVQQRAATFSAGDAHAGLVLGLGDRVLTTRSNTGSVQLTMLDAQLRSPTPFNCNQPGGGAASTGVAAVSCSEGVLRVAADASSKLIDYPQGSGNPKVAERLVAHPSEPVFAALLADELCTVRDAFKCVAQPSGGVVALNFDPSGKRVLVLTGDGVLHAFASDTLLKVGQLSLTAPSAALPVSERPTLANGRTQVYVSDPLAHQVYVVDATKLKHTGNLMLPSDATPTQIAVFRYP